MLCIYNLNAKCGEQQNNHSNFREKNEKAEFDHEIGD